MAISSLRLRRALAITSSILGPRPITASARLSPPSFDQFLSPPPNQIARPIHATQFFGFRTSAHLLDRRMADDDRKIDPDEILFEGCDYNHWLITMEFPKDPKPTPEEMVETYVQTLAKVVGSVEEAKKRMYACSTTTYTGFQAVMTEEMSEKFRGLPGVVFILPDSYIDPVNKEYGGDKYDNGVITPRPPPVQYGRQGRYGDRNRSYDRPRFDRQPQGPPPQQPNYGAPERRGYGPGEGGRDGRFPQGQDMGPGYGGGYQQQGPGQGQGYQGPPPPPPPPPPGHGGWDGRNQGYQGPPSPPLPPPPGPGGWGGRNQGNQGPPPPPGGNWDNRNQGYQGPPPPGGNWDNGRNQGQGQY